MLKRAGWVAWVLLPMALALVAGCTAEKLFPVANQHAAGWVEQHGQTVQTAGGADKAKVENGMTCSLCHTAQRAVDGSIPHSRGASQSCFSCHQGGPNGSPHPEKWNHSLHVLEANGYQNATVDGKSCATCHTTEKLPDGSIPKSPKASSTCFSCHGGPTGL